MRDPVTEQGKEKHQRKESRGDPVLELQSLLDHARTEMEEALAGRRDLTARSLHEIDMEIAEALRMLEMLGAPWKHGEKTEYEFMRLSIDKAIASRKRERRSEMVRSWRDVMMIREKLLQLRRELIAMRAPRD